MNRLRFGDRSAHPQSSNPLEVAAKFSEILLKDHRIRPRIKSVVVFGSAARQPDFVEGLSDVDVLVVFDRKSKRLGDRVWQAARLFDYPLSPAVLSARELMRMLRTGDPGALLMLRGKVLHDTGFFPSAKVFGPTEETIRILIDHAFCALSIALNNYFSSHNLPESVNCAYHSVRHALRAVIVKRTGTLAGSNEEVMRLLEGSPHLRKAFGEFVRARTMVRELMRRYDGRRARDPHTTLRNGIGKLFLRAERAAIESCEICLKKKPRSLCELLQRARKLRKCEIMGISWDQGWELVVRHGNKMKRISSGKRIRFLKE